MVWPGVFLRFVLNERILEKYLLFWCLFQNVSELFFSPMFTFDALVQMNRNPSS